MKLYGFYSWGGYKDMYFGELDSNCKSVYFLPLLSIMRNRNRPEEQEKIAWLETLPSIEIVRQRRDYGFPHECSTLFTHGGFSAIYQTLYDGRVCLCMREIGCDTKDEEGRSTPFSLLFLAESEEDIALLDNTAHFCLTHLREAHTILSSVMVFDTKANGLRADTYKVKEWMDSINSDVRFVHQPGRISYLMIPSLNMLTIVLGELKINQSRLDAIVSWTGQLLKGKLQISEKRERFKVVQQHKEEVSSDQSSESKTDKAPILHASQKEEVLKQSVDDIDERLNPEADSEQINETIENQIIPVSTSQNQANLSQDDTTVAGSCTSTVALSQDSITVESGDSFESVWHTLFEWLKKLSQHWLYPYILLFFGFLLGLIF